MYVAVDKYNVHFAIQNQPKVSGSLAELIQVNRRIIRFLYQTHIRLSTHIFCPVPVTLMQ